MQIVGFITSIIGLPAAIWFIIKIIRPQKNLSWKETKKGITYLVAKTREINPNYMITFSGRGDILVSLILTELDNKYPLYTCLLRRNHNKEYLKPTGWSCFTTSKWEVFVPDEVDKLLDKQVLIIDDLTISGETIKMLINYLQEKGMNRGNITTMTLLSDESVHRTTYIPTISWKSVKISEYNGPWGKTKTNNMK